MIKLPNANDTMVHADALVNQHGIMLFRDKPINGYSLEFIEGICSAVKKYTEGLEIGCYGIEYLSTLIPYSWDFTDKTVANFDYLKDYYGDQTFVESVHFKEELFSGYSIEFYQGALGTVSFYSNGDLFGFASWDQAGIVSEFGVGPSSEDGYGYGYDRYIYGDNNARFSYISQDASLHITFDERNKVHTDHLDRIYTRVRIEKNPFLYADEFNHDIGLGNVLSMKIFDSILLVEHLYLSGSGLTEEIIFSLMKNPEWHNVKKITVDSSAISEENMLKLLSPYPNISIDYLVD
ncbi:MAG: hypothetical protein ACI9DG_001340 [Oleispira sp.]